MDGQVVRVRAAVDQADDPVDGGIDDVVDVAGVVALQDAHGDPVVGVEPRYALCAERRRERNDTDGDPRRPTAE